MTRQLGFRRTNVKFKVFLFKANLKENVNSFMYFER